MIRDIFRFKDVSSTQDTAKRFVHRHQEIAVISERQRRGRGRHGRQWVSPKGGLYVSFTLFPSKRIGSIPLLAALTVVKLLEEYFFSRIAIHWPNDVFVNNKKICGVVCEQYKESIICGIGLNVNTECLPEHLGSATSMKIESGCSYDMEAIFAHVIDIFNHLYDELQGHGIKIEEALDYITGIGEVVEVKTQNGTYRATICDVNDDWSLLVRDCNGMMRTLYYEDVRRLVW